MDFHRDGFRRYLRHYVDALKTSHPDFQVISNWAFSDHMPEPVSAQVAGLSGDFSPDDSVNSARFAGRCLEDQGRALGSDVLVVQPQDADGRNPPSNCSRKPPSYSLWAAATRPISSRIEMARIRDPAEMDVMAEVAQFCRDRQAFCHRSVAVPQIALLYSTAGHYRTSPRLFHWSGSPGVTVLRQALTEILRNQYSVQISASTSCGDPCRSGP